jgi:hypothetical protein
MAKVFKGQRLMTDGVQTIPMTGYAAATLKL